MKKKPKKYDVPDGIRFADEGSAENYQKAMAGDVNEHGVKPVIAIHSPRPASGKSRVARHILEARFGSSAASMQPQGEEGWEKSLIAAQARGFFFVDNFRGRLKSSTLSSFVTAKEWSFRKLGTTEVESIKPDVQVVIAGNSLVMSEDMLRRVMWIELV